MIHSKVQNDDKISFKVDLIEEAKRILVTRVTTQFEKSATMLANQLAGVLMPRMQKLFELSEYSDQ
eukprot:1448912-Rhodomonas_salina.1